MKNFEITAYIPPFRDYFPLDPATLKYTLQYTYLQNLTLNLVEIDQNENYKNQLAKTIQRNDEGNKFVVTLKEAYFSNGDPIRVEDVAKSIKRAIILGTPHFNGKDLFVGSEDLKSLEQEIPGVEITGENELTLRIHHSQKEFYYYLQLTDLAILHPSQYNLDRELQTKDWVAVSSGPYRLEINDLDVSFIANEGALNYSKDMPKRVDLFFSKNAHEISQKINNDELDIGELAPNTYLEVKPLIDEDTPIDLFGSKTASIIVMALNIKNDLYKDPTIRKWILKKIYENFQVPNEYSEIMEKAYQFFLPNTLGFVPVEVISKSMDSIDTQVVPEQLKEHGLNMRTIEGLASIFMPGLADKISKALEIPVTLDTSIRNADSQKVFSSRDYEVYINGISMSYKVLGETLNFQYLQKDPFFQDPTGRIKELLKEYQQLENTKEEYDKIKEIIFQMIEDAECIPLYYYGSPVFVRSDRINIDDLYLDEAIQFWRIRAAQ